MNEKIGDEGRVIIRKSGTEPLIRVMVETDTKNIGETLIDEIKLSLNSDLKVSIYSFINLLLFSTSKIFIFGVPINWATKIFAGSL